MRKTCARLVLLGAALVGLASSAGSARADVVFSQAPNFAFMSSNNFESNVGNFQQETSQFSLTFATVITHVNWWGGYDTGLPSDTFTIRQYLSAGAPPAVNPLATTSVFNLTRTDTGMRDNGGLGTEVFFYSADLTTPLAVNANTTYWLSILDNTPDNWYWLADGPGTHYFRVGDGVGWSLSANQVNFAFQLVNPIPEPASMTLLVIGAAGLIGYGRRRRTPA
jgi:hypothetical protein